MKSAVVLAETTISQKGCRRQLKTQIRQALIPWINAFTALTASRTLTKEGDSARFEASVLESQRADELRKLIWRAFGAHVDKDTMRSWIQAVYDTLDSSLQRILPSSTDLASYLWNR